MKKIIVKSPNIEIFLKIATGVKYFKGETHSGTLMMRKIQKKRKSSTEKDAASDNMSADEFGKVNSDDPDNADSDAEEEEELWQHFAQLDGAFAQCGHCEKKVDCGTSLVFLRGHLKRRHPTLHNKKTGSSSKTDDDRNINLDGPIKKDNAEDESALNRRCRAMVWAFFVRLNKTSAQCKTCKRDFNYSASITNLKRHLRLKHPAEHAQLTSAKVSFNRQTKEEERNLIERKRKRAVKLSAEDINDCIDENEALDSDSEYQPETDDSDQMELDVEDAKKPPKRRKSDTWVWSSFEKIDQETARCTLCERNVDYRNSVFNLKKHLDRQHSEEMGGASKSFRDCADENEEASDHSLEKEDSDSLQTALDETCSRLLRRRKSDLWNHFSTLSKEIAQCKHCRRNLSYRSSATNLRKHLRVKHPRAHAQLGKAKNAEKESGSSSRKEPSPSKSSRTSSTANQKNNNRNEKSPAKRKSAVQKYKSKDWNESDEGSSDDNEMPSAIYSASDDDSADEREVSPVRSSVDAFSRIASTPRKRAKGSPAKKERKKQATNVPYTPRPKIVHAKRKRSRLWDFFTVLDDVYAECNTCRHRLVHKSGLSNLAKHYTMKHANPAPAPAPTAEQQQNAVGAGPVAGISEVEMAVNSLNHNQDQPPPDGQATETSGTSQPKKRGRRKTTSDNHWRCAIWRLFSKLDETFSQCKSCHKRISHRSTNANLLKHTRIKHPHIYYKFEERLKDFSHNVNILVDHFFPESLITASASGNNATQTAPSHEADDHMPQQEYHMTENQPPQMYDGYSFPVIFVQEEEAVHTSSQPIATTTVITSAPPIHAPPPNPIQVPPTNLPGPSSYGMGGHNIISSVGSHAPQDSAANLSSAHLPNHVQEPNPLNMDGNDPSNPRPINNHQPLYMGEGGGVVSHIGGVGSHIVGVANNVGGVVGSHGGAFPFNSNYQHVLTTSFNGGVAQSSDRLIVMVEESNQLLRGMQSAIERQSDVLIRLAESIATGIRAS